MHENGQTANSHSSSADETLCLAVKDAISRSEPIRASSRDSIEVEATDGKIVLSGLVGSDSQRYLAESLAAAVPGVRAVENLLIAREDLERTIAYALGSSETTRHLRIMVRATGRVPTLYGVVKSQAESTSVEEVARGAIHGLEVRNSLRILPPNEHVIILEQHSLEGRQMAGTSLKRLQDAEAVGVPEGESPVVRTPPAAPAEGLA